MKRLFLLSLATALLLAPSCKKEPISSVSLPAETQFVTVGGTLKLNATLSPAKAKGQLTWEVSNPTVASIDQRGTVTGLKPGVVSVYASSGLYVGDAKVVVLTEEGTVYRKGTAESVKAMNVTSTPAGATYAAYSSFEMTLESGAGHLDISDAWMNQELNLAKMPSSSGSLPVGFYFLIKNDSDVPTWYTKEAGKSWNWAKDEETAKATNFSDAEGFAKITSSSIQMAGELNGFVFSINWKKK